MKGQWPSVGENKYKRKWCGNAQFEMGMQAVRGESKSFLLHAEVRSKRTKQRKACTRYGLARQKDKTQAESVRVRGKGLWREKNKGRGGDSELNSRRGRSERKNAIEPKEKDAAKWRQERCEHADEEQEKQFWGPQSAVVSTTYIPRACRPVREYESAIFVVAELRLAGSSDRAVVRTTVEKHGFGVQIVEPKH
ncbi:uncharacterized protein SPSK_07909 [Sporothrix schenckii 1099-18]|uniref:Uncharacterized protein n=1 Tax=Sporothrix schenckii 1099-18 TaxID=1397361 RepID=A0A0F2MFE2_SPOSC|nr:uncharacterized protein SPSK_07909 [Sporothrix schenckii 1099-18]KJR88418.1 hypothetical protein SPSK_07909 [Sporothrix schenckii 1099-18]